MATTYEAIQGFLKNNDCGYHYDTERELLLTAFRTSNYLNEDGEQGIAIIIKLEENGEFLKVFAPSVYRCQDSPNQLSVFFALLHICWQTKMLQYEYDPTDGEVRATIEFPLEDATLTEKQFMRILFSLVEMIDRYDPIIRKALETGEVDFQLLVPDLHRELADLFSAMSSTGGIDELRRILQEANQRRGGPKLPAN
jgi:hypothetical protein